MIENRKAVLSKIFDPFSEFKERGPSISFMGKMISTSYGMCEAAYDIRLDEDVTLIAGRTILTQANEVMNVPHDLRAKVEDKSTNLRMGITVSGRAEPGWYGRLTLELAYVPIEGGPGILRLPAGWGIAAVEFMQLIERSNYGENLSKYHGDMTMRGAR